MITIQATRSSDDQNENLCMEPGTYRCAIVRADHETSKKGTPQLALEVDIYNPVTNKATMVKHWVPVTQKAAFLVEQLFAACGKKFAKGESIAVDEQWLRGKQAAVITCIRKTDQGGRYTQIIRFMNPMDCKNGYGPLTDEQLAYYCIQPDGTREPRQREAAPAQQQPQQGGWMNRTQAPTGPQPGQGAAMPNEEDDDIPF